MGGLEGKHTADMMGIGVETSSLLPPLAACTMVLGLRGFGSLLKYYKTARVEIHMRKNIKIIMKIPIIGKRYLLQLQVLLKLWQFTFLGNSPG